MKVYVKSPNVYGPKGSTPLSVGEHDLDEDFAKKLIKRGAAHEPGKEKEFVVNPSKDGSVDKSAIIEEYKNSDEFKSLLKSQDDDEMEQLHRLHEEILGKKAHHKSGAEKIADAILEGLEPSE